MMMRIIALVVLLAVGWLLWSGHYTPLLLGFGVFSCALVTVLARRIGFFDDDAYTLHLGPGLPRFWLWLLQELVKSNIEVARIVLHPDLPISPSIVKIDVAAVPRVSQATLGNAITLTPGTVTLDIDQDKLEAHCLTTATRRALEQGEMVRQVQRLSRVR